MAGFNVGPSQGFLNKIGQGLNRVGQQMPGPFGDMSKITGALNRPQLASQSPSQGTVPSNGIVMPPQMMGVIPQNMGNGAMNFGAGAPSVPDFWSTYNNLSSDVKAPQRQLFY